MAYSQFIFDNTVTTNATGLTKYNTIFGLLVLKNQGFLTSKNLLTGMTYALAYSVNPASIVND